MSNSTKKKSEKLGINFSTACHQLRRKVFFHLLQETGKNICYRCGEKIVNDNDLSLDHKIDWLGSDAPKEFFWDVENIGFSHKSCNTVAGNIGRGQFQGVTKLKRGKKPYQCRFWNGSKQEFVGNFETAIEAAKAYDEAILTIMGDKAVTNKSLGYLCDGTLDIQLTKT